MPLNKFGADRVENSVAGFKPECPEDCAFPRTRISPPMSRLVLVSLSIVALCAVGILLSLNGCGGGDPSSKLPPPNYNLPHVVIIFQENRTPDNLFQGLCSANGGVPGCGTNPGQYDIASSGVNSHQQTIALTPIDLGTVGGNPDNYDLSHTHSSFVKMCDLNSSTGVCKMDGADLIPCDIPATCPTNAYPNPQFKYVEPSDVQPYLQMAAQYTFANRMFQTNQGPSFPAHQFIL